MLIAGETPCPGDAQGEAKGGMECANITHAQEQTQFALWAIFASPLYMSADLRAMPARSRQILLNAEIIAVSQDKLGRQGRLLAWAPETQVWARHLAGGDVAVALYNRAAPGPATVRLAFRDVGFSNVTRVAVRDLYAHRDLGVFVTSFEGEPIAPTAVQMLRLSVA